MTRRLILVFLLYFAALLALLAIGDSFGVTRTLAAHLPTAILSFALLLVPYWFFGFGAAGPLARWLDSAAKRLLAAAALLIPWLVFVIPSGTFRWDMFFALLATVLAVAGVLELGRRSSGTRGDLYDIAALLLLAFSVELPFFRQAWPAPGLSGVSKLLFVDLGLFGFLVVRPLDGIGFVWHMSVEDVTIGLREFLFYLPLALSIGFVLHFLHFHPVGFVPAQFAAAWIFTLFFVAVPEEIFFRGLLLNLLERRWGTARSLLATSLIFGLAHFPKRAVFNWRYVILAAIAGFFYGRAWLAGRRVLTSGVTHATVDAVWSIWLR